MHPEGLTYPNVFDRGASDRLPVAVIEHKKAVEKYLHLLRSETQPGRGFTILGRESTDPAAWTIIYLSAEELSVEEAETMGLDWEMLTITDGSTTEEPRTLTLVREEHAAGIAVSIFMAVGPQVHLAKYIIQPAGERKSVVHIPFPLKPRGDIFQSTFTANG